VIPTPARGQLSKITIRVNFGPCTQADKPGSARENTRRAPGRWQESRSRADHFSSSHGLLSIATPGKTRATGAQHDVGQILIKPHELQSQRRCYLTKTPSFQRRRGSRWAQRRARRGMHSRPAQNAFPGMQLYNRGVPPIQGCSSIMEVSPQSRDAALQQRCAPQSRDAAQ